VAIVVHVDFFGWIEARMQHGSRFLLPMTLIRIQIILGLIAARGLGIAASTEPVGFNKDIRPILADACFHCHGPDPGTRKAGLRLDTEAGFFTAKKDEQPAVIKGQPDKSSLFQRLLSKDEDEVMPPPESHKELKPAQIALVKQWIAQGAPWQPHWSLIQPQRVAEPVVKDKAWVKTPVDHFVQSKLEAAGLKPAPEADAHALIRRVSLDLTGLPPSPDLVKRYATAEKLTDVQISALVDELMKSPAYGEHRARYWLDAARYGDSHGLHFDKPREMWPYRDWVVKAFNRNEPFDQFTVEQIAGDLLPKPTDDQLVATGFQRCNITTNEGGTIDEENLANYASDRVQTMGWVYFGLTTNCCQCHDHKFDPLTQRDYYSMAAFFRNTTQKAKDGNVKDGLGPVLVLPADKDRPRWTALPAEIAAAKTRQDESRKAASAKFQEWLAGAKPEDIDKDVPTRGIVAHIPLNEGAGSEVTGTCGAAKTFKATGEVSWKPDGKLGPAPVMKTGGTFDIGDAGDFEKDHAFSYGAWVRAGRAGVFGSILARMDEKNGYRGWDLWQNDTKISVHIVSKWPEDAIKVSTAKPALRPGVWQHVFVTYDGLGRAGGVRIFVNGEETPVKAETNALKGSIKTTTPTRIGQRSLAQIFTDGGVQDVRIYDRQLTGTEVMTISKVGPLRAMLAAKKRGPKQQEALLEHYLVTRDTAYQAAVAQSGKLTAEQEAIKNRSPITHIQEEKMGAQPMANILMRGAYDRVGEQVGVAVPAMLGKLPANAPKNRLGLAQWLVSADNPLTARVTVNRFWQELFGAGIVKTSDDFGIMGTAPTHPELLDWLAVEFRESGWDVKRFLKMLITSAAYRQATIITPEKIEKDRDNALLSRGPRFRMDAEMIRDYALAASGTLSPRMGGPGTMPYQPENIWEVVGLGTERYTQDKGENLYRRTIYNFWKRMSPSPNMDIFNAPSREVSCVRRDRTNTPLQALVTMNDPQFIEAARNLAQKAIACGCNDDAKSLGFIAERLLCRPIKSSELPILQSSLADLRKHYSTHGADAEALLKVGESKSDEKLPKPELAAWVMLCNQLMNLDEVLNK
jgi:mono/diheme cytochrome c family protein